jgi:hypothetical protein
MNAKFQRPVRVLSVVERERYKREVAQARAEMAGEIVVPAGRGKDEPAVTVSERRRKWLSQFNSDHVRPDSGILSRRIRRYERLLAAGSADSLSPQAKTALEKEARRLKGWLAGQMVPRSHQNIGYNHPDFKKAVQKGVQEWAPEFQKRAERFKNIMREVAPDDPDAGNLERIRPKNA